MVCPLLASAPLAAQNSDNHNFDVSKQLDIFNSVYRDLDLYYVDTLNAEKNIRNALAYMLQQLDPYPEHYPQENTEDLKLLSTGKYSGIGSSIQFQEASGRCVIGLPYENSPAATSGLLPGDILLSIDGKDLGTCHEKDADKIQDYSESVSNKLRGESGTTIVVKVKRPVLDKVMTFQITRQKVSVPSVSLATLVADSIGFISLSKFIEGSANEIRRALTELKQQGARSLILDLRDNPGGVMDEAVSTVNLFIQRGREVLRTRGKVKEANHVYKTTLDAQDPDIPLIVLTNFGTASAAEITSGALQDYDRAIILGERTYGKGLVQQSREMPYNGALKMTWAKYYIPSGRCIQAYDFKDGMPVHKPDSLAKEFFTAAGRIVRDGGSITPDIVVKADSLPRIIYYLTQSEQLFDYCVEYRIKHASIGEPEKFHLTNEEYEEFCKYMQEKGFTYDRQSLHYLEVLKKVARYEGYEQDAKAELEALEKKLTHDVVTDLHRWENLVRQAVEAAIVANYYYNAGSERYALQYDKQLKEAIRMLQNKKEMHKRLTGEPEA